MDQSKFSFFFFNQKFSWEFCDFFWPAHPFWRLREHILCMRAFIFACRHCEATEVLILLHGICHNIQRICHYFVLPKLFCYALKCAYLCTKNILFAGLLERCFFGDGLLHKNMALKVIMCMAGICNNI